MLALFPLRGLGLLCRIPLKDVILFKGGVHQYLPVGVWPLCYSDRGDVWTLAEHKLQINHLELFMAACPILYMNSTERKQNVPTITFEYLVAQLCHWAQWF